MIKGKGEYKLKFAIEHLSKSFDKKNVLRDIDFVFEEGKIYGLLGRNGAGKTTLFLVEKYCKNKFTKDSTYVMINKYEWCPCSV